MSAIHKKEWVARNGVFIRDPKVVLFPLNSSEKMFVYRTSKRIPVSAPVNEQVEMIMAYGYLGNCNANYAKIYGYKPADIIGTPLSDRTFDINANKASLEKFIKDGYVSKVPVFTHDKKNNVILEINTIMGHIEGKYVTGCTGKFEIAQKAGKSKGDK